MEGQDRLIRGHSAFSPVPKRVMDGSEPGITTPAAVLSGAPTDLQARSVRYAQVSRTHIDEIMETLTIHAASTVQPRPPRNPATGTRTNGAWTGTSWAKVTAGRTRSWAGNLPETTCKARI